MSQPALPPPDALLCERCGYALAGYAQHAPCPECGQAAGLSWPGNRPGSRYQRRAPGGWLRTNLDILTAPTRQFRQIRIDPRGRGGGGGGGTASRLFHVNLFVTAALFTAGFASFKDQWIIITPMVWLCFYAAMLLLTCIETLGLRFFARAQSRRWRITSAVAWSVCDHASVGWLIGGLVMILVLIVDPVEPLAHWPWANEQAKRFLGVPFTALMPELHTLQAYGPLFAGMLTFETLVFLGTRQCRYANSPASAAEQGPAGDGRVSVPPAFDPGGAGVPTRR